MTNSTYSSRTAMGGLSLLHRTSADRKSQLFCLLRDAKTPALPIRTNDDDDYDCDDDETRVGKKAIPVQLIIDSSILLKDVDMISE